MSSFNSLFADKTAKPLLLLKLTRYKRVSGKLNSADLVDVFNSALPTISTSKLNDDAFVSPYILLIVCCKFVRASSIGIIMSDSKSVVVLVSIVLLHDIIDISAIVRMYLKYLLILCVKDRYYCKYRLYNCKGSFVEVAEGGEIGDFVEARGSGNREKVRRHHRVKGVGPCFACGEVGDGHFDRTKVRSGVCLNKHEYGVVPCRQLDFC